MELRTKDGYIRFSVRKKPKEHGCNIRSDICGIYSFFDHVFLFASDVNPYKNKLFK